MNLIKKKEILQYDWVESTRSIGSIDAIQPNEGVQPHRYVFRVLNHFLFSPRNLLTVWGRVSAAACRRPRRSCGLSPHDFGRRPRSSVQQLSYSGRLAVRAETAPLSVTAPRFETARIRGARSARQGMAVHGGSLTLESRRMPINGFLGGFFNAATHATDRSWLEGTVQDELDDHGADADEDRCRVCCTVKRFRSVDADVCASWGKCATCCNCSRTEGLWTAGHFRERSCQQCRARRLMKQVREVAVCRHLLGTDRGMATESPSSVLSDPASQDSAPPQDSEHLARASRRPILIRRTFSTDANTDAEADMSAGELYET
jgi:hypothetical protein